MKVKNISYYKDVLRNEQYLSKKHDYKAAEEYCCSNDKNPITLSLDGLAAMSKPIARPKGVIKPRAFLYNRDSDFAYSIPDENNLNLTYIGMDDGYAKIKPKHNPKTLEINNNNPISADFISNLDEPCGSIAISTRLKENIATNGLWQCAGVSIVDRSQDLQTLLHLCPYVSKKTNSSLLNYILSASNPKNLEITIVPGRFKATDLTIEFLLSRINKYAQGAKVKYANFPDEDHTTLILSNGKFKCSDGTNIKCNINPMEKLIYASEIPE